MVFWLHLRGNKRKYFRYFLIINPFLGLVKVFTFHKLCLTHLQSVHPPCSYHWLSSFLYYSLSFRYFSPSNTLSAFPELLLPTRMFIYSFSISQIQQNMTSFLRISSIFPAPLIDIAKSDCYSLHVCLLPVCPSVYLSRGTTTLPMDGYTWYLTFLDFKKIWTD